MRSVLAFTLLAFLLGGVSASASDRPRSNSDVGVLWTPDGPAAEQVRTLRTMNTHGIRHVRVHRWPHPDALQAAATLHIKLYVDVDTAALNDDALSDDRLTHPAVHAIGWAGPLTANGCAAWTTLRAQLPTDRLRYVVTPVSPAGAACRFADDTLVLPDVRLMDRPFDRWYQWRQAHAGPVGLAALGPARASDRSGDADGWQVPRSALMQARTLERVLTEVHTRGVPLAFTAGWTAASDSGPMHFHLAEGDSLLSPGRVVTAATTAPPAPFAWPPGPASMRPTHLPNGTVAMVWLLLVGTIGALVYVPPMRRTVLRYLFAHAFYRESVQTGRDATPMALTALVALVFGPLWVGGFTILAEGTWLRSTLLITDALPLALQPGVEAALSHPRLSAGLITASLLGSLFVWATGATVALRAIGRPLTWPQLLMLGLLPWWGSLLWMLGAVAPTPAFLTNGPLVFMATALCVSGWASLRTAYDVHYTADAPLAATLGIALLAPGSLLLYTGFFVGYMAEVDVRWLFTLLWHA